MAGLKEGEVHSRGNLKPAVIFDRAQRFDGASGLLPGIERPAKRQAAALIDFINIFYVCFLYITAVR